MMRAKRCNILRVRVCASLVQIGSINIGKVVHVSARAAHNTHASHGMADMSGLIIILGICISTNTRTRVRVRVYMSLDAVSAVSARRATTYLLNLPHHHHHHIACARACVCA